MLPYVRVRSHFLAQFTLLQGLLTSQDSLSWTVCAYLTFALIPVYQVSILPILFIFQQEVPTTQDFTHYCSLMCTTLLFCTHSVFHNCAKVQDFALTETEVTDHIKAFLLGPWMCVVSVVHCPLS